MALRLAARFATIRTSSSSTTKDSAPIEGETQAAIVPTAAERTGDFSGLTDRNGKPEPLINEFTGEPFSPAESPSDSRLHTSPIALKAESAHPASQYRDRTSIESTQLRHRQLRSGRLPPRSLLREWQINFLLRYAVSSHTSLIPFLSLAPVFPASLWPTTSTTNSFTISHVHLISPELVQTARVPFFRNVFLNGRRPITAPASSLGFNYQPTLGLRT